MEFHSIREYFYKSYSAVMAIVLVPIVAFIALYLQPSTGDVPFEQEPVLFLLFLCGVAACWIALALYSFKKIKSLRNRQGLREKLEKYFHLTIVRFLFLSIAGMVMAFGFFVMRNDLFTIGFMINLLFNALLWPFPSTVTRQLKLRGDERTMVYYKRDILS